MRAKQSVKQLNPRVQQVYDCIKNSPTPQGAYNLLDKLRPEGFRAPSQMYRALNRLLELGLIHKVESLNVFVACDQSHQSCVSILAVCDSCGSVEEFPSPEFADQVKAIGLEHSFESREFAVELKGRCSDCTSIVHELKE